MGAGLPIGCTMRAASDIFVSRCALFLRQTQKHAGSCAARRTVAGTATLTATRWRDFGQARHGVPLISVWAWNTLWLALPPAHASRHALSSYARLFVPSHLKNKCYHLRLVLGGLLCLVGLLVWAGHDASAARSLLSLNIIPIPRLHPGGMAPSHYGTRARAGRRKMRDGK